jgi:hypothetical protein
MPADHAPKPGTPKHDLVHTLLSESHLGQFGVWLVLLSAGDLFVTYILLRSGSHFYEANPIANWFFQRANIAGMIAYKFLLVGMIVTLAETIERHRPRVGRAIATLGSLLAFYAMAKGIGLLMEHG